MFICGKISNYEDNNCDNNINIYNKEKNNFNNYYKNGNKNDKIKINSDNENINHSLLHKYDNLFNINNKLNENNNNCDNNIENNKHNNFGKDIQIQTYHVLKGLADFVGIVCICSHKTKDHVFIGYNKVKCTKYPEGNNIEFI